MTAVMSSWLPEMAGAGAVFGGVSWAIYLALISVAALTAIFSRKKTRRDAAKDVLQMLLWRRPDRLALPGRRHRR
jgi:hypothetical protein